MTKKSELLVGLDIGTSKVAAVVGELNDGLVSIIGAGSVGATIAYACIIRGVSKHIALYDVQKTKVDAEVLDLNHGLQFVPTAQIEGSDDIGICAGADVIVITAGAKQKPGQSRLELARANAQVCKNLVPRLVKIAPETILLLVTNPVDVITYITLKLSGLPKQRRIHVTPARRR